MRLLVLLTVGLMACGGIVNEVDASVSSDAGVNLPVDGGSADSGSPMADAGDVDAGAFDAGSLDAGNFDAGVADSGTPDAGGVDAAVSDSGVSNDAGLPNVDRSQPQLYRFGFTAQSIDADAGRWTGVELARLDTRVQARGLLVVYLHGAGAVTTCGSSAHQELLASWGFHTIGPCYASDYGVGNCGNDIGGCRLEAFDGVDRHPFLNITPGESLEGRVVKMLRHLQGLNPQGDWQYFLAGGKPRWDRVVISGISHGASTAGLIAKVRGVHHAVMLSGPLDTNQAWLALQSLTPAAQVYGFTHTGDPQHAGHLDAFTTMTLPGVPTSVDDAGTPWGGSHRLFTSATTADPHGSTQAGGSSPKTADGGFRFEAVWREMYVR